MKYHLIGIVLAIVSGLGAEPLQLVSSGPDGLKLELALESVLVEERVVDGHSFDDLVGAGAVRLAQPGHPALPYIAELLAAPPGAQVQVEVRGTHYRDFADIWFVPAPRYAADTPDIPVYEVGAGYRENTFFPAQQAVVERAGILRGVEAYALRVYPYQYNPVQRILRVYDRMEIRVRFVGGQRGKMASAADDPHGAMLYRTFINPAQAVPVPRGSAKRAAADWYDPTAPWVKVFVDRDGFYRIDVEALGVFAETEEIDPRTLRLIHRGQEQAVHLVGAEDGRFDAGDYLLFHGFFRQDDKNFESPFGRRNTYWLTWGGQAGLRLRERSAAPVNDYPLQRSFWAKAHFERDLLYDPLGLQDVELGTLFTGDNVSDHWFDVSVQTNDVLGTRIFLGELVDPDTEQSYSARIRVALHGETGFGHHTVVQLNNKPNDERIVEENIWDGQRPVLIERQVPSTWLEKGTNRLLLKVFADRSPGADKVYLNWFEIDYLHLYRAKSGYLSSVQLPTDGHRITITGFPHGEIEVFDLLNGFRFTGMQVDTLGATFAVTFEDRPQSPALYVSGDSLSAQTPRMQGDPVSALRDPAHQVDYLIVTHRRFRDPARILAEHRRATGLAVEVVETEDVYDEFSYGMFDNNALRHFIDYAYHNWQRPPTYVLLLGDANLDWRDRLKPSFVPTQYYHDRSRGRSPSDFFYALVDGDDLLADLAVGRLPVENTEQARDAVEKLIRYDLDPEPGDWRSRVIYLANFHEKNVFTGPSDSLATQYTEPIGLNSVKVYNPDDSGIPNPTGKAYIDAFNQGALLVNYSGHGSVGTMQPVFDLTTADFDYFSQVRNDGRQPLVLAFSCLNGLFIHPQDHLLSLGEAFTRKGDGGAIAYISAASKSFIAQDAFLGDRLFNQFFKQGNLEFGPALNTAKAQVLAAYPSWLTVVLTMQLFGDPVQRLALPQVADYTALSLRVGTDPIFAHSTQTVEATLQNNTRLTADSLTVMVLGYAEASAHPETLFYATQGSFAGIEDFSFAWPVRQRRGSYRLELVLDPEDRVAELYEHNNSVQLDLEILEPLIPTTVFPAANAVLPVKDLVLEAAVPTAGAALTCEFALATAADFAPEQSQISPLIAPVDGIVRYRPDLPTAERAYFWKVRLLSGVTVGPWSEVRSFYLSERETPPAWQQQGVQLALGDVEDLVLTEGQFAVSDEPLPFRPSEDTRDDAFTVQSLRGSGVLATDGTYVYTKRWYNDASTIYPGTDVFTRVGTGFDGTVRQHNYGTMGDSTSAGISATYHSDGYIYNDSGKAFELERVSVDSGRLDTVAVAAGLLEWQSGEVIDGHSLFTSDGRYIYNVAMSAYGQTRTEWLVRVFDPADDWAVVREFTSPPTETGFTFKWTDGVLADGQHLYFVEWKGDRRIRMVDAFDGRFLDEWTSDQDLTRIITGQYDWINNKVWMGDLLGSTILRYPGLGRAQDGQLVSPIIGPAAQWRHVLIEGDGNLSVALEVEETDGRWTVHPAVLSSGQVLDLSGVDAAEHRRIRLRAQVEDAAATLAAWEVDFEPLPALQLTAAEAGVSAAGLAVQLEVRNLAATVSDPLTLRLERSDWDEPWHQWSLDPLARGALRQVVFDSLQVPPEGVRLFAEILSAQPDAQPQDNRREVLLLFGGRAPLALALWPGQRPFLSGDPLVPGEGLLIHAPGVPDGEILLRVDGREARADSIIDAADGSQLLLYRPDLAPGVHEVEAQLLRDGEEIGFQRARFRFGGDLAIANALVYPHPVRGSTAFTYVLSHPAAVKVEIYSLAGRLVRRLEASAQRAGFQQLAWDGRDQGGSVLANGTYLYRIVAATEAGEAVFRGPLSVMR